MSQSALIDLSSVRVLCVDDDPVMRSVLRTALQRRGCREVVQAHGGTELFSAMIASLAGPQSVYGIIAFATGVISTYSSTSGVVLPVFLPMVPSLASATGAASPLAIALSINVGSALVDVSPLSTLGALCVAALGKDDGDGRLYFKLLAWGLAMAVVGAALCQAGAMLL